MGQAGKFCVELRGDAGGAGQRIFRQDGRLAEMIECGQRQKIFRKFKRGNLGKQRKTPTWETAGGVAYNKGKILRVIPNPPNPPSYLSPLDPLDYPNYPSYLVDIFPSEYPSYLSFASYLNYFPPLLGVSCQ